jgi:predicted Zn finger-like uncharacterized protein
MVKVNCDACGAPYEVDPRRVPPNGMKMRCPACGASVHVPAGVSAAAKGRPSVDDLDLDLPAPKARAAVSAPTSPATAAVRAKIAPKLPEVELSDLPALKAPMQRLSTSAADDLTDLPAPKLHRGDPALKKTAPAGLRPVAQPGPPAAQKPIGSGEFELDLPAPKQNASAAKSRALAPELRSPADARAALSQGFAPGLPLPSPELPLDPRATEDRPELPAASKKSFARPSGALPAPTLPSKAPAAQTAPPKGGLKDASLPAPTPFFADTAPHGPFAKLDDIQFSTPQAELIDLPAPQDLPAPKRPAHKSTAFGLGGGLPRDSLDIPAGLPLPSAGSLPTEPPDGFDVRASQGRALSEPMSELDLPAPRDLPAVKKRAQPAATAMGLGMPAPPPAARPDFGRPATGKADSAATAQARAPEFSLDLPPMQARKPAPAIDLGDFEGALDNLESKGGGSFGAELDLPPRSRDAKRDVKKDSLGDLEPIALPTAGASNTNTLALSTMELAPHELSLGGELGLELSDGAAQQHSASAASRRSDLDLELRAAPEAGGRTSSGFGVGSSSFGELDLGLGRDSAAGIPIATQGRPARENASARKPTIEDAQLIDETEELDARQKRRGKARGSSRIPGWAIPVALIATVGLGGTALGMFTEHGYFGVYFLEQLLPAAGDPARVAEALAQAERQAKSDTYVDVRKALVTLSDARNEAGLNRALLARSLLHEALYQLRFGDDPQSAQRSAAILARVLERGADAPGLTLARAADAARRGELAEARALLNRVPRDKDPYRALVSGELALLEKQPNVAVAAFAEAAQLGEVARGQWGVARAELEQAQLARAEQAARAVLVASPRHTAAHTLVAERELAGGAIEVAIGHVRAAQGLSSVDGVPARPARIERARAYGVEGLIEEKRDHPREAQAAYELALKDDPQNTPLLLGSARMLMRLGRPQDALSRFDTALSAAPSNLEGPDGHIPLLDAGLGAVQALLALQRPQEALQRSSALLTQFATRPDVKLWHGHVLEALERHDEAEALYRETIEAAPKAFAGYVGLSQLLFHRGRPEEAARILSIAAGKVDDSAEVRRMLGHSELTRNHLPEAVHQFEAALRFAPSDPGALFGLVVAHRKSGAPDAAEAALKRLEAADPTFPGLALERGQLLENRGDYAGATAVYQKALLQRPNDSELKLRLGAALVTAGQVDEAEAVLTQVLRERPNSAEAEHYLGRVLFARKETAQAAQRFERAVNFDMLKAEYHLYLAWALLEQGNYGGALQSVERAIQRDPNLGDARWILGRIQLRTGAVKDALLNFQTALRLKPGRTEALANMAEAYDELRDLPRAIESYQAALKLAPDHGDWWYHLGQLQLDRGKRDDARVAIAEAVMRGDRLSDRPSWLADAHRVYGDVLRESKREAEATDHYRLFLELAPLGHPDRAEVERRVFNTRR